MCGNVLVGELPSYDGCCKNGVCGGEACSHGQGSEEVQVRDQGINKPSANDPSLNGSVRTSVPSKVRQSAHPRHDRDKQEEQALPMLGHVGLGQFNADGEYTNGEDHSSEFERDVVDGFF